MFKLNEPMGSAWLGDVIAASEGDDGAAGRLTAGGGVTLYPRIDSLWKPRPDKDNAWFDEGVAEQVQRLIRDAGSRGVIEGPRGAELYFDHDGDSYWALVWFWSPGEGGGRMLRINSFSEELSKIGEPGLRGSAAAMSILKEVVEMANDALKDLEQYVAVHVTEGGQRR